MLLLTLLILPLALLSLASTCFLGGPRRYDLLTVGLALVLLYAFLQYGWWAAAGWFLLYGGLRGTLSWYYPRRLSGTERGEEGRALYLSFLPRDDSGRRPLVIFLPPLKGLLYWLAGRITTPVPQAGNRPASELVLPLLNQVYGAARGFRLDTRHLDGAGAKMPAMEIRCD